MKRFAAVAQHRTCRVDARLRAGAGRGQGARARRARRAGYAQRDDVRAFIDELAREHGLRPRRDVARWFAAARFQPKIVAAMQRPLLEPPKWYEYAPPFLSPARIDGGVAFWRDNAAALARAEATYGVPAEIIVAIIGVETFYGRNTGSHRVIDALATLAFDYPRRARVLPRRAEAVPAARARPGLLAARRPRARSPARWACRSSCPAAIAASPSTSTATAASTCGAATPTSIGSVANYLARHDWQRGQPVLLPAAIAADERATSCCGGSTAA